MPKNKSPLSKEFQEKHKKNKDSGNLTTDKGTAQSNSKSQSNSENQEEEVIERVFLAITVKGTQRCKKTTIRNKSVTSHRHRIKHVACMIKKLTDEWHNHEDDEDNQALGGTDEEVSDGANENNDGGNGDGEE